MTDAAPNASTMQSGYYIPEASTSYTAASNSSIVQPTYTMSYVPKASIMQPGFAVVSSKSMPTQARNRNEASDSGPSDSGPSQSRIQEASPGRFGLVDVWKSGY
jgi:hypothetical protein